MKCLLEEIEGLECNFSDMFSPNRSDSIRSTFIGEDSTMTTMQLACELKKQKGTLIEEFSEIMKNNMKEIKDVINADEQSARIYLTNANSLDASARNESMLSHANFAQSPHSYFMNEIK